MNLLAIDIGNSNITFALFSDGEEKLLETIPGDDEKAIADILDQAWQVLPLVEAAKTPTRDGVIVVSSVKPKWTKKLQKIAKETINEKIKLLGDDIPILMETAFGNIESVGTDRIMAAIAAYEVVGDAVVVADFGTAITIDLVDENGRFMGGSILPGFELATRALETGTAQLPKVEIKKPQIPFGQTTEEAINCGLYYSAVSTLQEITRRYAEQLGKWPHTIVTGATASIIKDDCDFVDSFVPDLVVKGIAVAYNYYIGQEQ